MFYALPQAAGSRDRSWPRRVAMSPSSITPPPNETDQIVAEREGLSIRTVEGDAADLSMFGDESFDLVFIHARRFSCRCARRLEGCSRVLRPGGI